MAGREIATSRPFADSGRLLAMTGWVRLMGSDVLFVKDSSEECLVMTTLANQNGGAPVNHLFSHWPVCVFLILSGSIAISSVGGDLPAPGSSIEEGDEMDVVPYGELMHWDDQGRDYGVIWEDSRDIFQVVVTFASDREMPDADSIQLEYWQSQWPKRRIPRDQPSGAGGSGWLDIGDWFQGQWKTADSRIEVQKNALIFTFNPLNEKEFPDLQDFPATYRTTMKLRILARTKLPAIEQFRAFTDSEWKSISFDVFWGGTATESQTWDGSVQAFNGIVKSVQPVSSESRIAMNADGSWRSTVHGNVEGVRAEILYADTPGYNSFDETVITVRCSHETFSFAPTDLIQWKQIAIPDFGVLVRKTGESVTYDQAVAAMKESGKADLYSRVSGMPEQTFTRAWSDTPAKEPHYIPLSFEGGRQHFELNEHGAVACLKNWITKLPGKDTQKCQWEGTTIRYDFGLPQSRLVERHPEDGYLPIIVSTWSDSGVRYRQTAFVTPLRGVPESGERIRAVDPLVMMLRFEIEREKDVPWEPHLTMSISDEAGSESLSTEDEFVYGSRGDQKRLRMRMFSEDSTYSDLWKTVDGRLEYGASMPPSRDRLEFFLAIPFVTLTEPKEWEELRALDFSKSYEAVKGYWEGRVNAGARIDTPEPMINDFYKAHLVHLLINTEREVGESDRYMCKVGTFHYGVYSNESCMMISDLDRRGYGKVAERALETWLHYQGTVGLPGDYSTKEGQFYGAGGYESGGYNQHHGWILWCMGEHYRYTRDVTWLQHAAPYLVKGCDWIIRERQRTKEIAESSPIRAIERGLLPPGRLEDIGDWRCWLSTNVYSWWGMRNAAAALKDIGHPEADRLLADAENYRNDILTAFTEAMRRSPVVRLRDGRWIPHIPPDVHRRGRSFGWITETLEGAIHLVRCGLLEPWDRSSTWIIQDFEDNLYLSEQYGYNLTGEDFDRFWFSRGGISMQANLLCNPIPYLLRDEASHYLRAYFNAFAVSYFPDTRMMTEHALPNIGDWRGDHYKTSDEANSTYWLRLMFVEERDDELWLGAAIPRYWLADGQTVCIKDATTCFGRMSVRMESHLSDGFIRMIVDPPKRNPPKTICARFRHPEEKRMVRCLVNDREYTRFNPEKEWVVLENLQGETHITVYYE